jgi:hypothetical protein
MLTCPMCKKGIANRVSTCPRCRTDLSLLTAHVAHLEDGLARAAALTRRGELGEAVWAYLEVLEVDPDHPEARRQVGRVATAVRQFDRTQPGRRWLERLRRRARFRRWLQSWEEGRGSGSWLGVLGVFVLAVAALALGYAIGHRHGAEQVLSAPAIQTNPEAP